MGDLSENADYHKAKEDQAFLEGRIQEIEAVLRTAVVVEKTASDVVTVGNKVTVQEESSDPEYSIWLAPRKPTRAMARSRTNPPSAAR
jgi:transcription elongation factor GreA